MKTVLFSGNEISSKWKRWITTCSHMGRKSFAGRQFLRTAIKNSQNRESTEQNRSKFEKSDAIRKPDCDRAV